MAEAQAQGLFLQELEFLRRIKTRNRQMIVGRSQVLSDGQDVNFPVGKIAKNLKEFGHVLAQTYHDA